MLNHTVMVTKMKRFAGSALAIALAGALPACIAVDVERRARDAFEQEGIPITGTQTDNGGEKREIKGNKNGLDITVSMEQQGGATKTEVSARKNLVEWDKDYAQRLLNKIVTAS